LWIGVDQDSQVKANLEESHTCLEPGVGVGVLSPLPPACEVRDVAWSGCGRVVSVLGAAFSALLSGSDVLDDLDDLDVDCDGIAEGGGVEVLNSGAAAGLGFARLREPMAQIERDKVGELQ
jgi:hypothetical protein